MSGNAFSTTEGLASSSPRQATLSGCLEGASLSRREAIKKVGAIGLGLSAARVPDWATPLPPLHAQEEIVPFTDIPESFASGTLNGLDLRELESWITPSADYFSVQHYGVPEVDRPGWRLGIGGLVDRSATYSLADLRSLPRVERTVTFECSGNQARAVHRLVGTANWAGASLREALMSAGLQSDAKEVIFWASDTGTETIRGGEYEQNFARSLSLEEVLDSGTILAYEMNGEPLPVGHGAPLRLVVPGYYGICNVKWLERIELSSRRLMNRFMARDYVTIMGREVDGGIEWTETSVKKQNVKSVVARVTRLTTNRGARFRVFGAAWTDGTPLEGVDVQFDEGAWQAASLEPNDNPFAWTFWTLEVDALPAGEHTLVSRATDQAGRVQPLSLELKRTYWEDNAAFRRTIMVS